MNRVYRKHFQGKAPQTIQDELNLFYRIKPLMVEMCGCDVIRDPTLQSGGIRATVIHSRQNYAGSILQAGDVVIWYTGDAKPAGTQFSATLIPPETTMVSKQIK